MIKKLKNIVTTSNTILIIGLSILAVGMLWITITVAIPLIAGDGLSKYSGAQREAAQYAVQHPYDFIDNKTRWSYTFRVEDVRAVSADEIAQSCKEPQLITQDTNKPAFYTVTIRQGQLFQLGSKLQAYIGCDSVSQR